MFNFRYHDFLGAWKPQLKEALVKLRDLSNEEKNAAQRAIKQSKAASDELDIKNKLVVKLEERNSTLEEEVEELKEQVDLALGAEEMVEQLTTRNRVKNPLATK